MEPSWTLTYRARPWLLNSERAGGQRGVGGHYGRAKLVREWRDAYAGLCLVEQVPALQWVEVEVIQECRDRRLPDIAGCIPAVKAAIDGIVDAGVIPDDGPHFLHALTFRPPVTKGRDALVLQVTGPLCSRAERVERKQAHRDRLVRQFR